MSSTRTAAFLVITWTVALAVLLAATELILRATDDGWGRTLRLNIVRGRSFDFDVSDLYPSRSPTIRYVRDQYGLRGDCGPPGKIDILTVGGSTTDQRFLSQDATFQSVMQAELRRVTGTAVCVSNAGVDGHSTYGHLRSFQDWFPLIPGLKPKLVIFSIGINDADFTSAGPNEFEDRILGHSSLKELRIVQLGLWLRDLLKSRFGGRPAFVSHHRVDWASARYTETRLAPDTPERAERNAAAFRMRLRRLVGDAHALGSDVVCVTQPHRFVRLDHGRRTGFQPAGEAHGGLDFDYSLRLINQAMREECGNARLVDVYSTPFEDGDFYDMVHTTPSGARKIGLQLAGFIAASPPWACRHPCVTSSLCAAKAVSTSDFSRCATEK
jgi:hypothetical protein